MRGLLRWIRRNHNPEARTPGGDENRDIQSRFELPEGVSYKDFTTDLGEKAFVKNGWPDHIELTDFFNAVPRVYLPAVLWDDDPIEFVFVTQIGDEELTAIFDSWNRRFQVTTKRSEEDQFTFTTWAQVDRMRIFGSGVSRLLVVELDDNTQLSLRPEPQTSIRIGPRTEPPGPR